MEILNTFLSPLRELNEFHEVQKNVKIGNTPIHITGCIDSQKCHLIYGISEEYPYRVIITHNDLKAKEIYEDYKLYDKNVYLYPSKDVIFYSAEIGRAHV